MKYLLINYGTNNVETKNNFEIYKKTLEEKNEKYEEVNARDINYVEFLNSLQPDDLLVLCGGDGTINYFANQTVDYKYKNEIYYYPLGSGNDFAHDILNSTDKQEILMNAYLKDLPTVYVKDKKMKFINGVGYGIDGYCCEVADSMKGKTDKPINYTSIAIKGLLFKFKPKTATIKIDGQVITKKKCWIAASMIGRYYGGGMNIAPNQDRLNAERKVSVVTYCTGSKLKALMVFPSIFTGEHVKKEKVVQIYTGNEIEVSFDKPCACQIDGETVLDVSSYKVTTK